MLKKKEKIGIFCIGSVGYGLIEILWRGYTHWSMLLTGGFCFCSIYRHNDIMHKKNHIITAILSACIITVYEFISGCIFNKILKLNVWDYSKFKGNVLGQICPLYFLLWLLFSFPLNMLCRKIKTNFLFFS